MIYGDESKCWEIKRRIWKLVEKYALVYYTVYNITLKLKKGWLREKIHHYLQSSFQDFAFGQQFFYCYFSIYKIFCNTSLVNAWKNLKNNLCLSLFFKTFKKTDQTPFSSKKVFLAEMLLSSLVYNSIMAVQNSTVH